jgi:adenine-specific DNA-methyltransferase
VAGPFTVESLSPHRVLGVGADDELLDPHEQSRDREGAGDETDFATMILENLKTAGVQQAHKEDRISFTSLTPWPGRYICAEGRFEASEQWTVNSGQQPEKQSTIHSSLSTDSRREVRAGIFVGPEFGTVARQDLVAAAREAGDADFDVLIACAFNYEAHAAEFSKLGRIPVLKARMNAELHMAEDLKNTGKGNLFVIFGEPDITVDCDEWIVDRDGRRVMRYGRFTRLSGFGSVEEVNRAGEASVSALRDLAKAGSIRAGVADAAGGGLDRGQHRRGSGKERDAGVRSVRGDRAGLGSGTGDAAAVGGGTGAGTGGIDSGTSGGTDDHSQDALSPDEITAVQGLTGRSLPLSTIHQAQVTIHGVDVFHPSSGEVRSDNADGIACWFIDTDYNEESFFVRHAYFLGANDPYKSLKTTLKAEINEDAWSTLNSDTSRPFDKPKSGRIAVKVINHLGDEVMKVFRVE